jgi:cyclopropane-fatty-acyl-phospholipid synthase
VSDERQLKVSYDVSNEFFRLILDETMTYSCALFDHVGEPLALAQRRKLAWLSDAAAVQRGARVLDIGCGWGGVLAYLVEERGVREAHGITLSTAQYEHCVERRIPGAEVKLVSYLDYAPAEPFDAAISVGMLEHVATPQESRSGAAIDVYRDYFQRVHRWTRPGAYFGLQTVMRERIPRGADLVDLAWVGREIFPGAISPRLEELVVAMSPYWELVELFTRRTHYAQTCRAWRERLVESEAVVRERFGGELFERYERYLRVAATSFDQGYATLGQLRLRRKDT